MALANNKYAKIAHVLAVELCLQCFSTNINTSVQSKNTSMDLTIASSKDIQTCMFTMLSNSPIAYLIVNRRKCHIAMKVVSADSSALWYDRVQGQLMLKCLQGP
jgi:hypothetical protein